jgi:hypothetical protein
MAKRKIKASWLFLVFRSAIGGLVLVDSSFGCVSAKSGLIQQKKYPTTNGRRKVFDA